MVPGGAVRSGKYKLIEWYEPKLLNQEKSIELFDLENDQGETTDLSETNPEKAAELQKMLAEWRTNVGAQMPTVNK
jgi:arylsulfatase A-like enzyme